MAEQDLSPREIGLAQRRFTFFTALNVISFQLLSGNIITLFALRLQASNFLIGLLYSFVPLAQIMPLVGRMIVARIGAVRTMSLFWLIRYIMMSPILLAPVFASSGRPEIGIVLIIISVIGFNLARGIGITGHNPVIAGITTDRDRGDFLARNQIVVHSFSILVGVVTAALLGAVSSLIIYALLIATGIGAGIAASLVVGKLPEPAAKISRGATGMMAGLRRAIASNGFGRFVIVLALKSFLIAMALPFLVVYLKRVHGQVDSSVIIFTVIGSLGAIAMAVISGLAIDTTGPKPVTQVFGSVLVVALILVVIIPGSSNAGLFWTLTGIIFFLATMGANGLDNGMSNYFFRLIPPDEVLNIGIVNFLVAGAGASIGSLAGGSILDLLESTTLSAADAFRVYYGGLVGVLLLLLAVVSRLPRLGPDYTARNVMAMFLSPRDLHAMGLLRRFRKGDLRKEEDAQNMIRALGQTRSHLSTTQLLAELRSPRFTLRSEALVALSAASPSAEARGALIEQVETQEYTTAYRAAEILGRWGALEAIPALRQGLSSSDFFLCGKCMVALALLGDQESTPTIEATITATHNPRLIIHGATALEILGNPSSVSVMVSKLATRLSGFVRDELNLALAGLLGLQDFYYSMYLSFIDTSTLGVAALKDYVNGRVAQGDRARIDAEALNALADAILGEPEPFVEMLGNVLEDAHLNIKGEDVIPVLRTAIADPALAKLGRFRFLVACVGLRSAFEDLVDGK